MKKIINHLKENWIKYGFETFVITIGILGAFALNSWNDDRKAQEIEIKLLKEMAAGLKKDLSIFDDNINIHNGGYEASSIILEALTLDKIYFDSLSIYFAMTHNYTVFSPNTGAYESLKSLGIEVIENDDIRLGAIGIYEQGYSNLQANIEYCTNYVMNVSMNFNPSHFEEFKFFDADLFNREIGSYGGRMVPINFEKLKTNQVYQYHLKSLKNWHDTMMRYHLSTKGRAERLITLIQEEIDLREN